MSNTYGHIEEADGTLWVYTQCHDPHGRLPAGRKYWVSYCNGPARHGIVGFYASSIENALDRINGRIEA